MFPIAGKTKLQLCFASKACAFALRKWFGSEEDTNVGVDQVRERKKRFQMICKPYDLDRKKEVVRNGKEIVGTIKKPCRRFHLHVQCPMKHWYVPWLPSISLLRTLCMKTDPTLGW